MDPLEAEATRRRINDMAAAERMPVVGYHFPFPAVGHIVKEGNHVLDGDMRLTTITRAVAVETGRRNGRSAITAIRDALATPAAAAAGA
jgi:hypothetical protein